MLQGQPKVRQGKFQSALAFMILVNFVVNAFLLWFESTNSLERRAARVQLLNASLEHLQQ